jgi:hypothetical protein
MGKIWARYHALERAKVSRALALWRSVGRRRAAHSRRTLSTPAATISHEAETEVAKTGVTITPKT